MASKDTVEILSKLQHAYPFPQTENDKNVHALLGVMNLEITDKAITYLEAGDAEGLGALMVSAKNHSICMLGQCVLHSLGRREVPCCIKFLDMRE